MVEFGTFEVVPLDCIDIPSRMRSVDEDKAKALADSIEELGLQQPIAVVDRDGQPNYTLIFGRHRIRAHEMLGRKTIPCIVKQIDAVRAEMAGIDENLRRSELTALERDKALARRKELYEALHPETKDGAQGGGRDGHGTRRKTENDKLSFSVDAAEKTGQSRRTIERAVAVGEAIPDDVAAIIGESPAANNQSELKALAAMPPETQREIAPEVAKGKKVRQAKDGLDYARNAFTALEQAAKSMRAAGIYDACHLEFAALYHSLSVLFPSPSAPRPQIQEALKSLEKMSRCLDDGGIYQRFQPEYEALHRCIYALCPKQVRPKA